MLCLYLPILEQRNTVQKIVHYIYATLINNSQFIQIFMRHDKVYRRSHADYHQCKVTGYE